MEFKIDTKETYTVIQPQGMILDAIMAERLVRTCGELCHTGSCNYIVDMVKVNDADFRGMDIIETFHEYMYHKNHSLVFVGVSSGLLDKLSQADIDLLLNVAFSFEEAVDLISMEILERDLLDEGVNDDPEED